MVVKFPHGILQYGSILLLKVNKNGLGKVLIAKFLDEALFSYLQGLNNILGLIVLAPQFVDEIFAKLALDEILQNCQAELS